MHMRPVRPPGAPLLTAEVKLMLKKWSRREQTSDEGCRL